MSKNSIIVKNLKKSFEFPIKEPGKGFLGNLLRPQKKEVIAVDDISFEVTQGERVAFIGPNGAGKSTTIKMLTGILFPSSGELSVLGLHPTKERKKLAYQIGTVFGQRSQLLPNLPLTDSFRFFGVLYDMDDVTIKQRTQELISLFDMQEYFDQPVRKLSLGQRMRGEIACSLIHKPKIIFLDEPTIGLDVIAKKTLRDLLLTINKAEQTTIFLTSHDVGDIESLCDRTIVINQGKLIQDLPTEELSQNFIQEKNITLIPLEPVAEYPKLPDGLSYVEHTKNKIVVRVDLQKTNTQAALTILLELFMVDDIDVYDTDLETIIRHIYETTTLR